MKDFSSKVAHNIICQKAWYVENDRSVFYDYCVHYFRQFHGPILPYGLFAYKEKGFGCQRNHHNQLVMDTQRYHEITNCRTGDIIKEAPIITAYELWRMIEKHTPNKVLGSK